MVEGRELDAYSKITALVLLLGLASCGHIVVLHDPLSPEEHVNLGVAYEDRLEYDNAVREYKTASGELPIAYLYMGNAHFAKKEYEQAEAAYEKAISKTRDPRAMNNLAWLYLTVNRNLDRALDLANEAVAISPESKDFKDTLEKILEKRSVSPALKEPL